MKDKYFKNSNGVIVKGDIIKEFVVRYTFCPLTNTKKVNGEIVDFTLTGNVIIDNKMEFGLDEKVRFSDIHNWQEIDYDEIEDLL